MIMKREDIIPRGNIQKVRRNLFGSPTQEDRDQFTKLYEEQMEKDRQEMERKYNFSFKYDMPIMSIDEKFEWEEVSQSEVPKVFRPSVLSDRKNIVQNGPPSAPEKRVRKSRMAPPSTTPSRRTSLKRRSETPASIVPVLRDVPEEAAEPEEQQPRKHRRVTDASVNQTGRTTVRAIRKQRRITDIFEPSRRSTRISPTKKTSTRLSPKSLALKKLDDMIMISSPGTPGMRTRGSTARSLSLVNSGARRRTLA
ncbi:Oidioi.mRNA.OKI2018_I69.XSR.g16399.t1.cds [Oikopleura dioica]|uniref:Oidioi.mRNA.OKI2018_I69.XSR.g16399.t1.cds n=1 Tax=Oikopleura dioica TaxID=34765 RepID=A0ABN7SQC4_OIKDI|nr:Oidioi.mRNA.OKI2018_I69.XSR.g16399.t1.cds [Oikopleura dioica]